MNLKQNLIFSAFINDWLIYLSGYKADECLDESTIIYAVLQIQAIWL